MVWCAWLHGEILVSPIPTGGAPLYEARVRSGSSLSRPGHQSCAPLPHWLHRNSSIFVGVIAQAFAAVALQPRLALAGDDRVHGLNDLMPAFWAVYDAARSQADAARAQSLLSQFFEKHAEDYRRAGVKISLAGISRWLPQFDAMAVQVRQVHHEFSGAYALGLQRFSAALPDFDAMARRSGRCHRCSVSMPTSSRMARNCRFSLGLTALFVSMAGATSCCSHMSSFIAIRLRRIRR